MHYFSYQVVKCLVLFATVCGGARIARYSVHFKGGKYSVTEGNDNTAVATGYFSDQISTTGWGKLSISHTKTSYSDNIQSEAFGFLESYLTKDRIAQSHNNFLAKRNESKIPAPLTNWMMSNWEWMKYEVDKNEKSDYWKQVGYTIKQTEGLHKGYNQYADKSIPFIDLLLITAGGDMEMIAKKVLSAGNPWYPNENPTQHCSGLIKLTADFSELFAGHTTWSGFDSMLRIYKCYKWNLKQGATVAQQVTFSAYPATLSSVDDYYVTDSKLVVIETTNGVFNNSLENLVKPESVLSWIRVIVANRMANDGKSWVDVFSKQNSGTYNNQWFIVDYKLFEPKKNLKAGLFWVLEQMPGYIRSEDMTEVLSLGYWPSYNIPYFKDVFQKSGFPSVVDKWGNWFTHDLSPRAKIFRRDQAAITNLSDFKRIMQYNDWQNDPFSNKNAGNQIASRFDLVVGSWENPFLKKQCFGGTDSKVTSSKLVQVLASEAISGPSHQSQKPFSWNSEWSDIPHQGQPDVFDFDWELMVFH